MSVLTAAQITNQYAKMASSRRTEERTGMESYYVRLLQLFVEAWCISKHRLLAAFLRNLQLWTIGGLAICIKGLQNPTWDFPRDSRQMPAIQNVSWNQTLVDFELCSGSLSFLTPRLQLRHWRWAVFLLLVWSWWNRSICPLQFSSSWGSEAAPKYHQHLLKMQTNDPNPLHLYLHSVPTCLELGLFMFWPIQHGKQRSR